MGVGFFLRGSITLTPPPVNPPMPGRALECTGLDESMLGLWTCGLWPLACLSSLTSYGIHKYCWSTDAHCSLQMKNWFWILNRGSRLVGPILMSDDLSTGLVSSMNWWMRCPGPQKLYLGYFVGNPPQLIFGYLQEPLPKEKLVPSGMNEWTYLYATACALYRLRDLTTTLLIRYVSSFISFRVPHI